MKTLFIPAKVKSSINRERLDGISKKLPKALAIAYSIQFKDIAVGIKTLLTETHNIISFIQVLGCSRPKLPKATKAVLLIGSGRFHAVALAKETKLPIYILEQNSLSEVSVKEIESYERKQKASYLKFLHADQIGILVSTKPGQNYIKKALEFKKRQSKKKFYLFVGNDLNLSEFENFGLDSWVNTACPRLDLDNDSIINFSDISH